MAQALKKKVTIPNFSNSVLYIPMLAVLNLPRAQCEVLMVLHSFCSNSNHCWPSLEAMRRRSGYKYKVKRISQILQELKWKGWVTIERKGFDGNDYYLHAPSGLKYFPDECAPLQVV